MPFLTNTWQDILFVFSACSGGCVCFLVLHDIVTYDRRKYINRFDVVEVSCVVELTTIGNVTEEPSAVAYAV